jgi:murein DD-endopeptidase MepM/ murein hydrolase activator NlpD
MGTTVKAEIKMVIGLFVATILGLGVIGFATKNDHLLWVFGKERAGRAYEPVHVAQSPRAAETPAPRSSTRPGGRPTSPEVAPPPAELAPESLVADPTSDRKCPLGRVAMLRGSDSEASEGGGFYATRKNGIHGAVDLNGWVGEPVFAVASGRVVLAARSDWGKLGKAVILDHLDGGYTIYGHLDTVEVNLNSNITAGHMVGTIGYSGNAKNLQRKNLQPHLHFAYVRALAGTVRGKAAPLARIKNSGEGLRVDFAEANKLADVARVLHPMWVVRSLKCWEDAALHPGPIERRSASRARRTELAEGRTFDTPPQAR